MDYARAAVALPLLSVCCLHMEQEHSCVYFERRMLRKHASVAGGAKPKPKLSDCSSKSNSWISVFDETRAFFTLKDSSLTQ